MGPPQYQGMDAASLFALCALASALLRSNAAWPAITAVAWVVGVSLAIAASGAFSLGWVIRSYTAAMGEIPRMCACTWGWNPLDSRWRRLIGATEQLIATPSYHALSAASAAIGNLVAWFLGRENARAPFDEAWLAASVANYMDCGCVCGRAALVRAVAAGGAARIEYVCHSLVARYPRLYIRAEFLAFSRPAAGEEMAEPAEPGHQAAEPSSRTDKGVAPATVGGGRGGAAEGPPPMPPPVGGL